jgi:hypothetical protein
MKWFLILLALVSLAIPAFGGTHIIQVLGTEPLFGTCASRDQFFAFMRQYPQREAIALKALGLDRVEFERAMRSAQNVVTGGPLRLDAMAYYRNGVKIVRDVQIPAHTRLWVTHLPHKTVYVPQLCGNISTVVVAAVGAYHASFPVSAQVGAQPTPFAGGAAPAAALATSAALVTTPVPSLAGPPSNASVPTTRGGVPSAAHHGKFPFWIFLIPIALLHGNSGSTGSIHAPILIPVAPSSSPSPSPSPIASRTPCPSPTPRPPTPCPSPSKHSSH